MTEWGNAGVLLVAVGLVLTACGDEVCQAHEALADAEVSADEGLRLLPLVELQVDAIWDAMRGTTVGALQTGRYDTQLSLSYALFNQLLSRDRRLVGVGRLVHVRGSISGGGRDVR